MRILLGERKVGDLLNDPSRHHGVVEVVRAHQEDDALPEALGRGRHQRVAATGIHPYESHSAIILHVVFPSNRLP